MVVYIFSSGQGASYSCCVRIVRIDHVDKTPRLVKLCDVQFMCTTRSTQRCKAKLLIGTSVPVFGVLGGTLFIVCVLLPIKILNHSLHSEKL